MAATLVRKRTTEKTSAVLEESDTIAETQPNTNAVPSPGMDANRQRRFPVRGESTSRTRNSITGTAAQSAGKATYTGRKSRRLVRFVGHAPLEATVFAGAIAMQRLRAGIYSQQPEGVGPEKYDETASAMIALLKYGTGMPFHRLEELEVSWESVTGGDAMGDL